MSDASADQRLLQLETTVAHLQHDLDQMHQALISLAAELKGARTQLARFEHRLQLLAEPPENRSPVDERPPHY